MARLLIAVAVGTCSPWEPPLGTRALASAANGTPSNSLAVSVRDR